MFQKKWMQSILLLAAVLITTVAGAQARFDFKSTPGSPHHSQKAKYFIHYAIGKLAMTRFDY
jgi:hypothetical protein